MAWSSTRSTCLTLALLPSIHSPPPRGNGRFFVAFIAPMVRRSEWFRRKMDSWRREALLGLVPAGSEQIAARSASEPRGLVHEFGRLVERQNIIEGGASMLRASSFGWWSQRNLEKPGRRWMRFRRG
ncbi:hypothetical protein B0H17DRAFT_1244037 [Mycena rosella]|uniref:Uncharacterized protein n=1 Tax=Mycena rosella TaxID=1033263 RepID=A0AAD7CZW3_MYCRO|nr:hypothetical protein B0H17DRAFT_1244037 [Mycena rosella]